MRKKIVSRQSTPSSNKSKKTRHILSTAEDGVTPNATVNDDASAAAAAATTCTVFLSPSYLRRAGLLPLTLLLILSLTIFMYASVTALNASSSMKGTHTLWEGIGSFSTSTLQTVTDTLSDLTTSASSALSAEKHSAPTDAAATENKNFDISSSSDYYDAPSLQQEEEAGRSSSSLLPLAVVVDEKERSAKRRELIAAVEKRKGRRQSSSSNDEAGEENSDGEAKRSSDGTGVATVVVGQSAIARPILDHPFDTLLLVENYEKRLAAKEQWSANEGGGESNNDKEPKNDAGGRAKTNTNEEHMSTSATAALPYHHRLSTRQHGDDLFGALAWVEGGSEIGLTPYPLLAGTIRTTRQPIGYAMSTAEAARLNDEEHQTNSLGKRVGDNHRDRDHGSHYRSSTSSSSAPWERPNALISLHNSPMRFRNTASDRLFSLRSRRLQGTDEAAARLTQQRQEWYRWHEEKYDGANDYSGGRWRSNSSSFSSNGGATTRTGTSSSSSSRKGVVVVDDFILGPNGINALPMSPEVNPKGHRGPNYVARKRRLMSIAAAYRVGKKNKMATEKEEATDANMHSRSSEEKNRRSSSQGKVKARRRRRRNPFGKLIDEQDVFLADVYHKFLVEPYRNGLKGYRKKVKAFLSSSSSSSPAGNDESQTENTATNDNGENGGEPHQQQSTAVIAASYFPNNPLATFELQNANVTMFKPIRKPALRAGGELVKLERSRERRIARFDNLTVRFARAMSAIDVVSAPLMTTGTMMPTPKVAAEKGAAGDSEDGGGADDDLSSRTPQLWQILNPETVTKQVSLAILHTLTPLFNDNCDHVLSGFYCTLCMVREFAKDPMDQTVLYDREGYAMSVCFSACRCVHWAKGMWGGNSGIKQARLAHSESIEAFVDRHPAAAASGGSGGGHASLSSPSSLRSLVHSLQLPREVAGGGGFGTQSNLRLSHELLEAVYEYSVAPKKKMKGGSRDDYRNRGKDSSSQEAAANKKKKKTSSLAAPSGDDSFTPRVGGAGGGAHHDPITLYNLHHRPPTSVFSRHVLRMKQRFERRGGGGGGAINAPQQQAAVGKESSSSSPLLAALHHPSHRHKLDHPGVQGLMRDYMGKDLSDPMFAYLAYDPSNGGGESSSSSSSSSNVNTTISSSAMVAENGYLLGTAWRMSEAQKSSSSLTNKDNKKNLSSDALAVSSSSSSAASSLYRDLNTEGAVHRSYFHTLFDRQLETFVMMHSPPKTKGSEDTQSDGSGHRDENILISNDDSPIVSYPAALRLDTLRQTPKRDPRDVAAELATASNAAAAANTAATANSGTNANGNKKESSNNNEQSSAGGSEEGGGAAAEGEGGENNNAENGGGADGGEGGSEGLDSPNSRKTSDDGGGGAEKKGDDDGSSSSQSSARKLLGRPRPTISIEQQRIFSRQFFATKIDSETERLTARLALLNETFQLRAVRDLTPLDRQSVTVERLKATSVLMAPRGTNVLGSLHHSDANNQNNDKRRKEEGDSNSGNPANTNWFRFTASKFATVDNVIANASAMQSAQSAPEAEKQQKNKNIHELDTTLKITSENMEELLPSLSQIPTLTSLEILSILHRLTDRGNKLLLFAGDSMLREMFHHLVHRIRFGDRAHASHYWRTRCGKGHRNSEHEHTHNHNSLSKGKESSSETATMDYCGIIEQKMKQRKASPKDAIDDENRIDDTDVDDDYHFYDDQPPFYDFYTHNDVIYSVFPDGDVVSQYLQVMGKSRNRKYDFMFRRKLEEMRDEPAFIARIGLPRVDLEEFEMEEEEEKVLSQLSQEAEGGSAISMGSSSNNGGAAAMNTNSSSRGATAAVIDHEAHNVHPIYAKANCPDPIPIAYCHHPQRHLRPLFQMVYMWDPMTSSRVETFVESPNFKYGKSLRKLRFDVAVQVNAKPYWEVEMKRPKRVFAYLYDNAARFESSPFPNQTHHIFMNAPIPKRQLDRKENYKNYLYTRKNAALWYITKEIHQLREAFHDSVAPMTIADVRSIYNYTRMAADFSRWEKEVGALLPKHPVTTFSPDERGADRKLPHSPNVPSSSKSIAIFEWDKLQQLHQFTTSDLKHFACCLSHATSPHDRHPKYISKALSYFTKAMGAWSGERHYHDLAMMTMGDSKDGSSENGEGDGDYSGGSRRINANQNAVAAGTVQPSIRAARPSSRPHGTVITRRELVHKFLAHERTDIIFAENSRWALNTTEMLLTLAGEDESMEARAIVNEMAAEATPSALGSARPFARNKLGEQQLFRDFMAARSISQPGVQSMLSRSENEPSFAYWMKFNVKRQPGAVTVRRIDDELQCRNTADWAGLQVLLYYMGGLETTY